MRLDEKQTLHVLHFGYPITPKAAEFFMGADCADTHQLRCTHSLGRTAKGTCFFSKRKIKMVTYLMESVCSRLHILGGLGRLSYRLVICLIHREEAGKIGRSPSTIWQVILSTTERSPTRFDTTRSSTRCSTLHIFRLGICRWRVKDI